MTTAEKISGGAVILAAAAVLLIPNQEPTALPIISFGDTNLPTGLEWTQTVSNGATRAHVWTVESSPVIPPIWTVQTQLSATVSNSAVIRYHFPRTKPQEFFRIGVR